ncbi:NAD+ diphosphatase [Paenibacillus uliginis N3/975]|uniref:NAD(+) diphosphatase n=1 Tax=Paenibacillus uliginis N3/975 TaxID=1313296 RepID=A0A1X7HIY7_9BACL|nr:NUDIX domain-containing protein [Paenibacillus uliginis]SMF86769.1 NAD+ diphosphatase [Paenibacillus uliginis N3/975]
MKYCYVCGTELHSKECEGEGLIPYCDSCQVFRFPIFSTAISTAVLNKERNKVLLIRQYNMKDYILLAGYVNRGESAEETLIREVEEEVGLHVDEYKYMRSLYFERSNTLMLNFVSVAHDATLMQINEEVEHAEWFAFDEARKVIMKGSLAESFLLTILERIEADDLGRPNRIT